MYRYIVLLHVLCGFFFMMAHGASAASIFVVRKEKDYIRLRAMLDLSSATVRVMYLLLLLILVTGIVAGVMGGWWRLGWFWTSLALLILITIYMAILSGRTIYPLKDALGLYPTFEKVTQEEIEAKLTEPVDEEKVQQLLATTRPWQMLIVSVVGWSVIVWLMMFKPY